MRKIAWPVILFVAGCSSATSIPMSTHMGMVETDLSQLTAAAAEHKTTTAALTQLSEFTAVETTYAGKNTPPCDDMKSMCTMMGGQCMNANGEMAMMQPMSDLVDQMKQECANHKAAMTGAADLTAAKQEEDRHQAALSELQSKMKTKMDGWAPQMGGYSCSEHMHGM